MKKSFISLPVYKRPARLCARTENFYCGGQRYDGGGVVMTVQRGRKREENGERERRGEGKGKKERRWEKRGAYRITTQ